MSGLAHSIPRHAGSRDAAMPGVSPEIYSRAEFTRVSQMIHAEAGIVMGDSKQMLVYSRLAPLVRESGLATFAAFLDALPQRPDLRARVIASLTTNHTYFNREAHHYEHFKLHQRPGLVAALQAGQRVRVWSAGCSSGEEVYTLAMTMLGTDPFESRRLAGSNLRFLASDLAPHAIARAAKAEYDADALRAIPEDLRQRWVSMEGNRGTIAADIRGLMRFRQLNLLGEWPMRGGFDVIFCRNVMIYFDGPTKDRLVARLATQLVPDGLLYIGHSERVSGPASELLESVGPTVYRRRSA